MLWDIPQTSVRHKLPLSTLALSIIRMEELIKSRFDPFFMFGIPEHKLHHLAT